MLDLNVVTQYYEAKKDGFTIIYNKFSKVLYIYGDNYGITGCVQSYISANSPLIRLINVYTLTEAKKRAESNIESLKNTPVSYGDVQSLRKIMNPEELKKFLQNKYNILGQKIN